MLFKCSGSLQLPTLLQIQLRESKVLKCICRYFVLLALFIVLLGVLQKQAVPTCVHIYMRRWVLMSTPAGVVQGRLLFVVVVQARCVVVLLFLFEHFNTVQCPTLRNSTQEATGHVADHGANGPEVVGAAPSRRWAYLRYGLVVGVAWRLPAMSPLGQAR